MTDYIYWLAYLGFGTFLHLAIIIWGFINASNEQLSRTANSLRELGRSAEGAEWLLWICVAGYIAYLVVLWPIAIPVMFWVGYKNRQDSDG